MVKSQSTVKVSCSCCWNELLHDWLYEIKASGGDSMTGKHIPLPLKYQIIILDMAQRRHKFVCRVNLASWRSFNSYSHFTEPLLASHYGSRSTFLLLECSKYKVPMPKLLRGNWKHFNLQFCTIGRRGQSEVQQIRSNLEDVCSLPH